MKVLSTYAILKSKALNESVDESWVDWAIEMMEEGHESLNLYMLAGERKPYDQFHLEDLTNRVLRDLKLDYSDKESVIKNYVYYLISKSINQPETYFKTLRELRDIYHSDDINPKYLDFYLLYYAKDDLNVDTVQWYWPDANRENIDQIIKEKFEKWITEYSRNQK